MKYSNKTNELLCTMLNENGIDKSLFPHDALHQLFSDNIIRNSSEFHNNKVYLTDKGKAYVESVKEEHSEKNFQHVHIWINTGIAAVSLIASIIALIVSLMP